MVTFSGEVVDGVAGTVSGGAVAGSVVDGTTLGGGSASAVKLHIANDINRI
jgi:hypothetical protein